MKSFNFHINMSTTATTHLLGGLARQYREYPPYAPGEVQQEIKLAIIGILHELEFRGENIREARSPFNSYVKLVKYDLMF